MTEDRNEALRIRVADFMETVYRPGRQQFHAITHAVENPISGIVAFSGSIYDAEGGFPISRTALLDRQGAVTLLNTDGANDIDPSWSPDGSRLAWLADRGRGSGNFQLCVADAADPATPVYRLAIEGEAIESYGWSGDGKRILVQSADAGADAAGSASLARVGSAEAEVRASWEPTVQIASHHAWRRARIWDFAGDRLIPIGADGQNVWEAAWCGGDEIVAILSASPTEGGWYETEIGIAPVAGGAFMPFATSALELGSICASPDGARIAVLEGRFHRSLALGTLVVYDRRDGSSVRPDVGAELSTLRWRSSGILFFAGFDAPQVVVGQLDLANGKASVLWRTDGAAGRKVSFASPAGVSGALIPAHAFDRYPRLLRVDGDGEKTILDLATPAITAAVETMGPAQAVWWKGRDGLDIQGYLAIPPGAEKAPLVTFVHGGPSHLFRNGWSLENPLGALLVRFGYAVFFPNPRGSSGRGLDFASRVIADWGGEDRHDILAGIDHVVAHYPVDGERLFVLGGSYGGYMTSWLVTQTDRFRAACAMVPLTDMRSFFFTAHHPEFLATYTGGNPYEVGGIFDERSPLRHADKVTTPTLLMAGALDNTTPSTQASQFYRALALRGVPTELVVYPEEGHAVTRFEAQLDQGVRLLRWFETWAARG